MEFVVGDILSVPLFAHTRHFFVYIGNGEIVEWGPWDGISWMGGKGSVSKKTLFKVELNYKYLASNGELQEITLERRTRASSESIVRQVAAMTKGIDYHVGLRNCEHFACYITGQVTRSEQSVWHLFTDHNLFTGQPMICTSDQLRDALLKCRFCGPVALSKEEFTRAMVSRLQDNYFTYEFHHLLGGIHLYVSSTAKADDFESSYDSVTLACHGALAGRGEMLNIIRQLRGN